MIIIIIIIACIISLYPVSVITDVNGYSDDDTESLSFPINETITLNVNTGLSYDQYRCFWEWSLPYPHDENSKDSVKYTLNERTEKTSAVAECNNWFGSSLGREKVKWRTLSATYQKKAVIIDDIGSQHFYKCPDPSTGMLIISNSSKYLNTLKENDIISSSSCNGFLARLVSSPDSTGQASYTNSSLSEVILASDFPVIALPFTNSNNNRRILNDFNIIDKYNWDVPFNIGSTHGSINFNQLTWDISTDLNKLHYENGEFKGLEWQFSTTAQTKFKVQLTLPGIDATVSTKIPILTIPTPPLPLIPFLPEVLVSTITEIYLVYSADINVDDNNWIVEWDIDALLLLSWKASCDKSFKCSGQLLNEDISYNAPLSGMVTRNNKNPVNFESKISLDLVVGVSIQFDEVMTVADTVSYSLAMSANSIDEMDCPLLTLSSSDTVSLNARFFILPSYPIVKVNMYTGPIETFRLPPPSDEEASPACLVCREEYEQGDDEPYTLKFRQSDPSFGFTLHYETYSVPDRIVVRSVGNSGDQQLFDSGCLGTNGYKSQYFPSSTMEDGGTIYVEVQPDCDNTFGTQWKFNIECDE